LSVVELGLYESTLKTYKALAERGVEPHSEEWNKAIEETIARQKEAMKPRLFPGDAAEPLHLLLSHGSQAR
jgi:hydrogen peroxide-dependent heme synthase